jgi:hypothetical protein
LRASGVAAGIGEPGDGDVIGGGDLEIRSGFAISGKQEILGSPIETESNESSSTEKSRANQPGFVVFWTFAMQLKPGSSDRNA